MTVLYTTHYMEEAQELSDRVGIIDHGVMILSDVLRSKGMRSIGTALPAHALGRTPWRFVHCPGMQFRGERAWQPNTST